MIKTAWILGTMINLLGVIAYFKDICWNSSLIWNDLISRNCFKIIVGIVGKNIVKQTCHVLIVVEAGDEIGKLKLKYYSHHMCLKLQY